MNFLKEYVELLFVPANVRSAADAAEHNLYTGTSSIPFSEACDIVREWVADNIYDVAEDMGEEGVLVIESEDIVRELFGNTLYPYIS